jgi:predicted permease
MSVRALQKSSEADLGFSPDGVLTASYDLVLQNYPPERRLAFRRELLARVGALPGVTAVALANVPPLGGTMIGRIAQPSDAGATRVEMFSFTNGVGPGYFSTLGIPLLSGREFDERDQPAAPHVAIVNETFARRFWNDLHGVGRTVRMDKDAYEVIGVAKDSKYDEATEEPQPFVYVALAQDSQLDRETLFARTRLAPEALVPAVRDAIRRLDPALPVFDVQSFARVLQQRQDKQRAISLLLAAFGALALGLAAVGLYGVTAYAVTRRTGELGVRLALGATPGQLTRMIARDGLRLALVGMTIGAVLAAPLTRAVGALVFGIRIGDVAAFGGVCGLLVAVALAAALLAARRALRVDPITALRAE